MTPNRKNTTQVLKLPHMFRIRLMIMDTARFLIIGLLFVIVFLESKITNGNQQQTSSAESVPQDGWYNNIGHPDWGAVDSQLLRRSPAKYNDSVYEPAGRNRPNPFVLSMNAHRGNKRLRSRRGRTSMLVFFGQQIVEEIVDSQRPGCPREYISIRVPKNHHFNPHHKNDLNMPLLRSRHDKRTGHSPNNPRQQLNEVTPYLDGGVIYGTSKAWTDSIREFKNGWLKTDIEEELATSNRRQGLNLHTQFPSPNDIRLPFANPPLPREHRLKPVSRFFLLGNARGFENPFLLTFGVLWFRFHNFKADELRRENTDWTEEKLFQETRRLVIAYFQKIVMYDWLPRWMAIYQNQSFFYIPPYYKVNTTECHRDCYFNGYESELHPGISQEFQTAAMRFGHTLIPSHIWIRGADHSCHQHPTSSSMQKEGLSIIRLCNTFWESEEIVRKETMVDDLVRGMASTLSEREDNIITSDLLENTFGPLEWSQRDLAALNIQRGRDHGLADYNDIRQFFKLKRITKWSDINVDNNMAEVQKAIRQLKQLYNNSQEPNDLDLFVGGLLESTDDGPGPLFQKILLDQFLRIRHSDRFWFENRDINRQFSDEVIAEIMNTTLKDIILKVTNVKDSEIQSDIFILKESDVCGSFVHPVYNDSVSDKCTELKTYDYFTGSELSYMVTFLSLCLWIPGTFGVMIMLAKQNKKKLKNVRSRGTIHRPNDDPNQFKAVEWVGRKAGERMVKVKFDRDRMKIHVTDLRNVPLRMIDLRNISKKKVNGRFSTDVDRNVLSIRVAGEIDLILRFATEAGRNKFRNKFLKFLQDLHIRYQETKLNQNSIFEYAETKEERKKILDQFFRVICLQAFDRSPHEMQIGNLSAQEINKIRCLELTKTEFADAFGLRPDSIFVRNMFLLFDYDRNGFLGFKEFFDMFILLSSDDAEGKVRMVFNMYDLRRTGKLTRDQFHMMITSLLDISESAMAEKDADKIVQNMYMSIGLPQHEDISFDAFSLIFSTKEYEKTLEQTTFDLNVLGKGQSKWKKRKLSFLRSYSYTGGRQNVRPTLNPDIETKECVSPKRVTHKLYMTIQSIVRSYSLVIFWSSLYTLVTLGIFFERAYYYSFEREHSGLRRIAGFGITITRGSASVIMFAYATMLLTMCRNTTAYLRKTFLYNYFPFDAMHSFHLLGATIGMVFTALHCIGHALNLYHISTQSSEDLNCYFREYYRSTDELSSFHYWTFQTVTGLTGVLLVILVTIIYVFALPYARENVYNLFGLTHKCYIPVYVLLILHGSKQLVQPPLFQNFFIGPATLFVIDKLISVQRRKTKVNVISAVHLPSDVVFLKLKRPSDFDYKSGQWLRLACEQLGSSEFHPFTITSAPHEDFLSLHIRAVGPWTTNLRQVYDPNTIELQRTGPSVLYIDGPFGDGSQDWYRYPVSILVGGGIGVTPFASILKDIVFKSSSFNRCLCKKVYFVWITKTQKQFEWMTDIIREVENNDSNDFVTIHTFITEFKGKYDMRTTMLYICERHFQKVAGVSLFTGLKAVTHFGRPRFVPLLQSVQIEHPTARRIGVFSCGPIDVLRAVERAVTDINTEEGYPLYIHHCKHF